MTLSLNAGLFALASRYFALDLTPLIDGISAGFDLLFDFVIELLPIIILLGIVGIIIVAFKMKG